MLVRKKNLRVRDGEKGDDSAIAKLSKKILHCCLGRRKRHEDCISFLVEKRQHHVKGLVLTVERCHFGCRDDCFSAGEADLEDVKRHYQGSDED